MKAIPVLILVGILLMAFPVCAAPPVSYPAFFKVPFNTTTGDNAIYNESYRWNDNPTTPYQNLYLYVILAVVLSVLGYRLQCEYCTVLSIMFSIMGAYAAQAVEFTYYGVTSVVNTGSTPLVFNYVAMTNHEITPMPNLMIAMGVICVLMLANLYMIYVWHRGQAAVK